MGKGSIAKRPREPSCATVSPEKRGATVDFGLNQACIDLALTEFLFDAMLEGSRAPGLDTGESCDLKEGA